MLTCNLIMLHEPMIKNEKNLSSGLDGKNDLAVAAELMVLLQIKSSKKVFNEVNQDEKVNDSIPK